MDFNGIKQVCAGSCDGRGLVAEVPSCTKWFHSLKFGNQMNETHLGYSGRGINQAWALLNRNTTVFCRQAFIV